MAVQAQYPSNIFLFNRNEQEGHDDYSLQPQPGGGRLLLDQSNMMFANGGSGINPRKRGREAVMGSTITTPTANVNNPINDQIFSIQQQQQQQQLQLIDVSQLHNQTPPNVVSTGLRLSFGDQQHPLHQTHHYQQQSFTSQSSSSGLFSLVSDDFGIQIKRQREELDQFLQAQGEQLRRTLAEKRQNHYRTLLGAAEESMARQLRVKEAEVVKATRRNAELEARAAQLSMEAQVWQAKARAQEATAASLQTQLQQAIMSGAAHDRRKGDDGLGCPGGGNCQAEDAESAYVDPDRVTAVQSGPSCKSCLRRAATVVLLPCRHLCVCMECDQVINACPSCRHVRESSVEVFMF